MEVKSNIIQARNTKNVDQLFEQMARRLDAIELPRYMYSLGEEKEDAVCMLFENSHWIIFEFERNVRHNEKKLENLELAIREFSRRVTIDKEDEITVYKAIIKVSSRLFH